MDKKLNAQELRNLEDDANIEIKRNPIYFILDNVYDTYNIGGIFRLADALAISKMYLCGMSDIPPNPKIKKSSIGTYKVVPWIYKNKTEEAIAELRKEIEKIKIIAVEQDENSISFENEKYPLPIALVFGNETSGISCEVLKQVDSTVEIPMFGINKSLNVIISAAIVSYQAILSSKLSLKSS
jgi:tRNA G18 (ribose-2'-O)-methylase SpoU